MKRDMKTTAEKAMHNVPDFYDINSEELRELLKKTRTVDPNDAFDAIVTAFHYGFVLGHRATAAGKVKHRL